MGKTKQPQSSSAILILDNFAVNFMHIILGGVSMGAYFFILLQSFTSTIEKSLPGYLLGSIVWIFAFGAIYFFHQEMKKQITSTINYSLIINAIVGFVTIIVMGTYFPGDASLINVISLGAVVIIFLYALTLLPLRSSKKVRC